MDSITHLVTGALIGEVMLGKQLGKKAMLWGAIAGSLPDIDSIMYLFTDDVDSLVLHRGFTHSLIAVLLVSPILAWFFNRKYPDVGWGFFSLFFIIELTIHDFLDTATIYGTGLFEPISSYRYSWDNIFVLDPLFTLPILIAFIYLWVSKTSGPNRRVIAMIGLTTGLVYMGMTFMNKNTVEQVFKSSLEREKIIYTDHFTAPVILNNFLWHAVAKTEDGYYIGHYSMFDHERSMELFYVPRNNELLGNLNSDEKVKKLKHFSKGFYCVSENEDGTWFNDMRFGQVDGWNDEYAQYAFSFNLEAGADNSTVVQRGRIEFSKREALRSLWDRIKGW